MYQLILIQIQGPGFKIQGDRNPIPVELDPRQFRKIVNNLLSNALKFSDPEEGRVWIRIRPSENEVELQN